ncbi:uncharacterized protein LOC115223722 [Octopus sinensis]|uniref:Uncharacterized protein LOC115223722 n=1 Tax=Octopus sinensis TaxID=2607531 RepID=A0A7E6FNF8_9MOLL|nr:uncharacterized protein LOC115223722 [Octopus sinensis]
MGNWLGSNNEKSSTPSSSPPPPTPSTSFSPPTPSHPYSPPTPSTSFSPPTPSHPFSPPSRTTLSPPTSSTGTSQKQDTTKADKDVQRFLIQLLRDVSMAAYCPDPNVMHTALRLVDTFGPVKAFSTLWEMYPRLPSEKQISLFHIFLSLRVKYPGTLVFDEEELFLPHNGLLYFHKNQEWILLAYLIIGIQDYPDSLFHQMACFEDTSDLTLVEILQEYSLNIPPHIDLLIEKILVNGAPCEYLCAYRKAPALHVAAEIATVSGQFQTFSYVLQWASTSRNQLDATDRNKQTAFERICDLVDDHPSHSKKVLTLLLNEDCRLPHNTSESCRKIPVECVDAELFRLKEILESTALTGDYECAAVQCRRGVDLLLCCHQVKDLSKYYQGLYAIHLDKKKKVKLRSAHYTFTFLNYLENTFCYLKRIKEIDKDIDAILENVHKMEEDEANKFLLEKSKSSKSWPMLHFLLSGTKPRLQKFNASHMNISTLLESRTSNEIDKSSALELLMNLLRNGLLSGHDSAVKIHKILQLTLDIGCLDALDYCLNNKNINVVNARNETLLHSLVQTEVEDVQFYIKVMKLLLKKGIKKSMKDSQGRKAEDLVSIVRLPGALLKVENINCCDNLGNVMDEVKKLKSTGNRQLLASYCTVGMYMLLETGAPHSKSAQVVEFCTTSAMVAFALGFAETAVHDLAHAISWCNSVQDVLLVSDVYYRKGNYKMALKYCEKAYEFIPPDFMSNENYMKPILYETIKITVEGLHMTSFPCYKTKPDIYDVCKGLESFILQCLPLLFNIGNEAVKRGEDLLGAFAFNTFYTYWPYHAKDFLKTFHLRQLDTSVFKMDVMQKLIVLFVKHNFDLRKLALHDGDTYLHSCVKLSLYYGYFDLLELIINCRTIKKNELHIIDNNMRTAFDLLGFCRNSEFHERTQNILLLALMQVPSKKKISMQFPNPVYLNIGDGVVVRDGGGQTESAGITGMVSGTAAAVGKGGIATAAVSKKGIATAAVSKKGKATAAVSKKGMATAAVSNKRKATSAVSKKGMATAAVSKKGMATAAVSNKRKATSAVSKKGIATAAVGKEGIATSAVSNKGIATAAVSKKE